MNSDWKKAEEILNKDGVVILPTDTLYGIIGKAESKKVVERIYKIKGRNENKPLIVLINSYKQLEIFRIKIEEKEAKIFSKFWPGKVSIILPCNLSKWEYLHRGTNSIAFRMIGNKNKNLFNLISKVGPLVAPSANPEGEIPSKTIQEAKKYFGSKKNIGLDNIDLYISNGKRDFLPSTLLKYENQKFIVLRK